MVTRLVSLTKLHCVRILSQPKHKNDKKKKERKKERKKVTNTVGAILGPCLGGRGRQLARDERYVKI